MRLLDELLEHGFQCVRWFLGHSWWFYWYRWLRVITGRRLLNRLLRLPIHHFDNLILNDILFTLGSLVLTFLLLAVVALPRLLN